MFSCITPYLAMSCCHGDGSQGEKSCSWRSSWWLGQGKQNCHLWLSWWSGQKREAELIRGCHGDWVRVRAEMRDCHGDRDWERAEMSCSAGIFSCFLLYCIVLYLTTYFQCTVHVPSCFQLVSNEVYQIFKNQPNWILKKLFFFSFGQTLCKVQYPKINK